MAFGNPYDDHQRELYRDMSELKLAVLPILIPVIEGQQGKYHDESHDRQDIVRLHLVDEEHELAEEIVGVRCCEVLYRLYDVFIHDKLLLPVQLPGTVLH